MKALTIGIDATNLRRGGGRTHLIELLRAVHPEEHGIGRIIIWAAQDTLNLLEDREWLVKRSPRALNEGLLRRSFWQRFRLTAEVRAQCCDVLFVPGGSYVGTFRPVVTMSQNLLPFEWRELRRYGWTFIALKLLLLRWIQSRSFQRSDGVIFLTNYARNAIEKVTGTLKGTVVVIPHGLNTRFAQQPRKQFDIASYSTNHSYRVLYVSIVDQYKHQWHVVEAIGRLRKRTRWPIQLDLVGPAHPPALSKLFATITQWDPEHAWVNYHGAVSYDEMHNVYQQADMGLWASTCESLSIILLESMAAGLPVASSNCGSMPEVLCDAGVYFDPENPETIVDTVEQLIASPELRTQSASRGFDLIQQYSWERCATETFGTLVQVAKEYASIKN